MTCQLSEKLKVESTGTGSLTPDARRSTRYAEHEDVHVCSFPPAGRKSGCRRKGGANRGTAKGDDHRDQPGRSGGADGESSGERERSILICTGGGSGDLRGHREPELRPEDREESRVEEQDPAGSLDGRPRPWPSQARKIIAAVRDLTKKPIRTLIHTHWHDDHVYGNQAFAEAFPGLEIVAHQNTREDMQEKALDLTAFRQKMAGSDKQRSADFDNYFVLPASARAYKEARGEMLGANPYED